MMGSLSLTKEPVPFEGLRGFHIWGGRNAWSCCLYVTSFVTPIKLLFAERQKRMLDTLPDLTYLRRKYFKERFVMRNFLIQKDFFFGRFFFSFRSVHSAH